MRALLKTFEEKRQLIELLEPGADLGRRQVVIGSEMPFRRCRRPASSRLLSFHDRVLGVLGVVGPRRMPYAKIVPLVEYTARLVSRRLTRLGGVSPLG
jgi:heat-inducible transcriptional repressor